MWRRRQGVNLVDSDEMLDLFERLDRLNREQLMSMGAIWQSTDRRAHEEAWATVRAVGAREGLSKEIDRVRKKALAWSTRGSDAFPYTLNVDLMWQQVKMEAGEAIVDAALATALGSRLDGQTRETLLGPWLRATEASE
jgi:hypothetical protein